LNDGPQRRYVDSKHERNAKHAFIAYQGHIDACAAIHGDRLRNAAIDREVNVPDTPGGYPQIVGKRQLDLVAIGDYSLTILAGKGGYQAVRASGVLRGERLRRRRCATAWLRHAYTAPRYSELPFRILDRLT
jgi:hypothetical protein